MLTLPLALAVLLRRRQIVPWRLFCWGMAAFLAAQLIHLSLNHLLEKVGLIGQIGQSSTNLLTTAVVLGLSAALCETAARVLLYAILFRRQAPQLPASWMVGLGHGGIEAMIIAVVVAASLSSLYALQGVALDSLALPAEQLTAVASQLEMLQSSPFFTFAALAERLLAMSLHVVLSVLVWLAFAKRQPLWVGLAVFYHALIDATAVYASQQISNPWLIELLFLLMLLPGLVWLVRLWRQQPQPPRFLNSWRTDLYLLATAVAKEWRQRWRNWQFLIVTAVFLLFGFGSPLLAKFTPELLRSLEGMDAFAAFIPEPTTADAIAQYLKNITQFGFILVIVLGMGSVAAEKEKGVATLILSKPLPRWAFLLSKLLIQGAMFGLALLVGALGAYYYTAVLFGGLDLAAFLFGNLLLWLWLMLFAAITLLASTLTRNSGAAAGLALAGAVLLFLLGSIPQIGQIMPSALIAWASQLGLATAVPANGGAIATAVLLLLALFVTAVAVFEHQEL